MLNPGYDKLINYALRILSKKRYTEGEMRSKLEGRVKKFEELEEKMIGQVIERLYELKYLDDERFIRDYIADRINFRPRGKFLIKRELKLKGVDEKLLDKVFDSLEIDETEMAKRILNKVKKKWAKETVWKQKQKAFSTLSSKGFGTDAIYKAVESCYGISVS